MTQSKPLTQAEKEKLMFQALTALRMADHEPDAAESHIVFAQRLLHKVDYKFSDILDAAFSGTSSSSTAFEEAHSVNEKLRVQFEELSKKKAGTEKFISAAAPYANVAGYIALGATFPVGLPIACIVTNEETTVAEAMPFWAVGSAIWTGVAVAAMACVVVPMEKHQFKKDFEAVASDPSKLPSDHIMKTGGLLDFHYMINLQDKDQILASKKMHTQQGWKTPVCKVKTAAAYPVSYDGPFIAGSETKKFWINNVSDCRPATDLEIRTGRVSIPQQPSRAP